MLARIGGYAVVLFVMGTTHGTAAQVAATPGPGSSASAPTKGTTVTPSASYVIGVDDVLSVVFWREKDLTADVVVRPDGRITLPLLNDIEAAGLTPEQLRDRLAEAASRYVANPNPTVVVKAINSRKVFVLGSVSKPGPYPLTGDMTVLQMIALSGGLSEFADAENIQIMRTESGKPVNFKFNYKEVSRAKNIQQNILLKPGDTLVVP